MAVDFDAAADNSRIAAEARLPELVTDDGDRAIAGRSILLRQKASSERRLETERGKVVPADDLSEHALVRPVNIQAERLRLISHQSGKDPIAVAEIDVVWIRRRPRIAAAEIAGVDRREFRRLFNRQRTQE